MNESANKYDKSEFLKREATDTNGNIVPEVWQAIKEREDEVEKLIDISAMDKGDPNLKDAYFASAKRVRNLQAEHGIYLDNPPLESEQ
jgi:hypothetical protein